MRLKPIRPIHVALLILLVVGVVGQAWGDPHCPADDYESHCRADRYGPHAGHDCAVCDVRDGTCGWAAKHRHPWECPNAEPPRDPVDPPRDPVDPPRDPVDPPRDPIECPATWRTLDKECNPTW